MGYIFLNIFSILLFFVVIFLIGFFLNKTFKKANEEKCYYCNRKLGKAYYNDKTRYRERKGGILWCHEKCIPKDKLNTWRRTH
jgi:hypothetical protein